MAGKITGWVAFAMLAALYVYMVVAAIGNLLQFPTSMESFGFSINSFGWFWIWFGIALPVAGFLVAAFAGRRRSGGARLLIFATALACVAALQLEISLLVPVTSFLV